MALYAERFARIILEVVFEIRTMRIMTTDTGNHLSSTRVLELGTDRMCKDTLGLMTSGTCINAAFLEHGQLITAMGAVAIAAGHCIRMTEIGFTHSGKGGGMTGAADLHLTAFQQTLGISGMGRMAVNTGISRTVGQMTMLVEHLLNDLLMAGQADLDRYPGAAILMAVLASFGIRLVEKIANHAFIVAAVRIMTGQAVIGLFRESLMPIVDIRR